MKKVIEFNVRNEYKCEEILKLANNNVICAYKKTSFVNDKVTGESEGLCELNDFISLKGNEPLNNVNLMMYKKEIEQIYVNNCPDYTEFYKKLDDVIINNPYTYIQNNKDWGLYRLSTFNNSLYDCNGEELPKGIQFNFLNGHMNNGNYDLEAALEMLEQREDIKFQKGENIVMSISGCVEGDKHLSFIWTPSKEDYDEIKNINISYKKYRYIINKIFGIKSIWED